MSEAGEQADLGPRRDPISQRGGQPGAESVPRSPDTAHRLAELINGYRISAAIGALARVGVADALAAGALSAPDLARSVNTDEQALRRLLDATLAAGLFALGEDGRYALTSQGELLRSDVEGSLRRFAVVSTESWRWAAYSRLDHTLRTGEPGFVAAHGCRLWDYLAAHPEAAASFTESMARIGAARDRAVAALADVRDVRCLVDVGGGDGSTLSAFLAAHPRLHGIVFDLPEVIEDAVRRLNSAGVAERAEAISGDFREGVPSGGDAYLLSWILHDWDDATALRILGNCRSAMTDGALLLVVEMVLPEPGDPRASGLERIARQADLEMLTVVGGRERTVTEYERLLVASGFVVGQTSALEGLPFSLIEATAA